MKLILLMLFPTLIFSQNNNTSYISNIFNQTNIVIKNSHIYNSFNCTVEGSNITLGYTRNVQVINKIDTVGIEIQCDQDAIYIYNGCKYNRTQLNRTKDGIFCEKIRWRCPQE